MLKAQWDTFAGLFTQVMDLGPRERGEILGGVLITVLLLVIELLTGHIAIKDLPGSLAGEPARS